MLLLDSSSGSHQISESESRSGSGSATSSIAGSRTDVNDVGSSSSDVSDSVPYTAAGARMSPQPSAAAPSSSRGDLGWSASDVEQVLSQT